MCFRFGSCFGSGGGQDYGRSTSKTTHRGGGGGHADHGYYSGADHKSGPQAYHLQPAADEARKGHVDDAGGARKDHVYHLQPAGYTQDKADDELKQPAAWISKVGDDAGQTYTARLQGDAVAAADHHHYLITTTTATSSHSTICRN